MIDSMVNDVLHAVIEYMASSTWRVKSNKGETDT